MAHGYVGLGIFVVREVCKVKKLVYRFLDKDGRSITAKAEAVKATVEGDVGRVDTSEGTLVLRDVSIAVGSCDFLYTTPAIHNAIAMRAYIVDLGAEGFNDTSQHGDIVRVRTEALQAPAAAALIESRGRWLEMKTQFEAPVIDPIEIKALKKHFDGVERLHTTVRLQR